MPVLSAAIISSSRFPTPEKTIFSGDLIRYNPEKGVGVLTNFINRVYEKDGSSEFKEDKHEFEFNTHLINPRIVTTREDRLGRIVQYNEDLMIEELERKKKLRELEEQTD